MGFGLVTAGFRAFMTLSADSLTTTFAAWDTVVTAGLPVGLNPGQAGFTFNSGVNFTLVAGRWAIKSAVVCQVSALTAFYTSRTTSSTISKGFNLISGGSTYMVGQREGAMHYAEFVSVAQDTYSIAVAPGSGTITKVLSAYSWAMLQRLS